MKHRKAGLLLAALGALVTGSPPSFAQDNERSYTEGVVVSVSNIRTEPGKFDDYLKYLATTYKTVMEEYKKAGIILDYAVYQNVPTNLSEPDLILTITYKNLGALDNLDARQDPIARKVWGSLQASNQAVAERGKLRTQLGGRLLRQLILK
jgi:DNA-binding Lrp family transcriptional regulator